MRYRTKQETQIEHSTVEIISWDGKPESSNLFFILSLENIYNIPSFKAIFGNLVSRSGALRSAVQRIENDFQRTKNESQ